MVGGEPSRSVILAEEGRRLVKRQVGQRRPTFCIVADWASISAFNGLAQLIAKPMAMLSWHMLGGQATIERIPAALSTRTNRL